MCENSRSRGSRQTPSSSRVLDQQICEGSAGPLERAGNTERAGINVRKGTLPAPPAPRPRVRGSYAFRCCRRRLTKAPLKGTTINGRRPHSVRPKVKNELGILCHGGFLFKGIRDRSGRAVEKEGGNCLRSLSLSFSYTLARERRFDDSRELVTR